MSDSPTNFPENENAQRRSTLADTGVKRIAASVLFMRPRLKGILKRKLKDSELLQTLLAECGQTKPLGIHAENSFVNALPAKHRKAIYDRLRRIATSHGLKLHLCGCKNPDLTSETCHISGVWKSGNADKRKKTLLPLD